jgi:hypothetical protein
MGRFYIARRTATKVKNGRVQKKNRHAESRQAPLIRRERPGHGHVHVVTRHDLARFFDLLPDWERMSRGLHTIVLARFEEDDPEGWYNEGEVHLYAWPRELWVEHEPGFYSEHAELFRLLGIPVEKTENGFLCQFNAAQVRAYQLLHVLLHELGHHHDAMTTRDGWTARDEQFAEDYAHRHETIVRDRYFQAFGRP